MIDILLIIVAVILVALALLCAGNFYKGKHAGGPFAYYIHWLGLPANYPAHTAGRHRGKYVEDPKWSESYPPWRILKNSIFWTGNIKLANVLPQNENDVATLTLTPSDGITTIPALCGAPPDVITFDDLEKIHYADSDRRRQEIRELVDEALTATPIYTGMRYERHGRFGDSDIDRADTVSLRTFLPDRSAADLGSERNFSDAPAD